MGWEKKAIHVVAGVLEDGQGRVLVTRRLAGKHMAHRWEFPGGKLEVGEMAKAGLARELNEELGVQLEMAEPMIRLTHQYADHSVLLDVWRVRAWRGEPQGLDGQAMDWVRVEQLADIDLLDADRPIVTALRLPPLARCIRGIGALRAAVQRSPRETLFWDPGTGASDLADVREAVQEARKRGHCVIASGGTMDSAKVAALSGADGVLLEPGKVRLSLDPTGSFLGGVICSTAAAATRAVKWGAHFLVLVPDPKAPHAANFAAVLKELGVPAYLGWFDDPNSRACIRARAAGAHGCAIGP